MPQRIEESELLVPTTACQIWCVWTRSPLAKWYRPTEVKSVGQLLRHRSSDVTKQSVTCYRAPPRITGIPQVIATLSIWRLESSSPATQTHTRTPTIDETYQRFSLRQWRIKNKKTIRSHRKYYQCTRKWRTIKQKTSNTKLNIRTGRAQRFLTWN